MKVYELFILLQLFTFKKLNQFLLEANSVASWDSSPALMVFPCTSSSEGEMCASTSSRELPYVKAGIHPIFFNLPHFSS